MDHSKSSHRTAVVNSSVVAADTSESPRKGRKWSLNSTGSPEQSEPKEPENQPRGFRLMSPRKALELKKQAKARKKAESELNRQTGDAGSGSILPIWEKAPKPSATSRRSGINIRAEQVHKIEDPSEDGSVASVGMEEVFGIERTTSDMYASASGMQWNSPTMTRSAPTPRELIKPETPQRRSKSDETAHTSSDDYYRSMNFADLAVMPYESPVGRKTVVPRPPRRLDHGRSIGTPREVSDVRGCLSPASSDQHQNPPRRRCLSPGSTEYQLNTSRRPSAQYSKNTRRENLHDSLNLMEVFDDHDMDDDHNHNRETTQQTNNASDDALTAQEEEIMAMALEQSVRDVGGISIPIAPMNSFRRSTSIGETKNKVDRYGKPEPDFEKAVLKKSQEWTTNTKYAKKLHKPPMPPRIKEEDDAAARLAEEEQEKEMIQLAMERSLAETGGNHGPCDLPPSGSGNPDCRRGRRRYEQPENRRTRAPPTTAEPADPDEMAKREEEMIRRALEMSRNDF